MVDSVKYIIPPTKGEQSGRSSGFNKNGGLTSASAKGARDIVGRKTGSIGEREHVGEGDRHPFPASRLAADHGPRGSTLRPENIPGQQRQRRRQAPFGGQQLSDLFGCLLAALD